MADARLHTVLLTGALFLCMMRMQSACTRLLQGWAGCIERGTTLGVRVRMRTRTSSITARDAERRVSAHPKKWRPSVACWRRWHTSWSATRAA